MTAGARWVRLLIAGVIVLSACDLFVVSEGPHPARLDVTFDYEGLHPSLSHVSVAQLRATATDLDGNVAAVVTVDLQPGQTQALVEIEVLVTAPGQTFLVTIEVLDPQGQVVLRSAPTAVEADGPQVEATLADALQITTTALSSGFQGLPYTDLVEAVGGSSTNIWAVTVGSLPPGLTLDGVTGVISGIATAAGSETFTVEVTNDFQTEAIELTIQLDPKPDVMWVAAFFDILIIETVNHTVAHTIPLSFLTRRIAFTPDSASAYVTTNWTQMYEYDVETFTAVDSVEVYPQGGGVIALDLAITPDGAFAYVSPTQPGDHPVVETATNSEVARVPPFSGIQFVLDLKAHPNGSEVWIPDVNIFPFGIVVVETATHTVTDSILTSSPSREVEFTADGSIAYLTLCCSSVAVMETATETVVTTIPVVNEPRPMELTPDEALLYVGSVNANEVTVIETAGHTVVTTVPLPGTPVELAATPDGAFVYVATSGGLVVIETTTHTVVTTITGPMNGVAAAPR